MDYTNSGKVINKEKHIYREYIAIYLRKGSTSVLRVSFSRTNLMQLARRELHLKYERRILCAKMK